MIATKHGEYERRNQMIAAMLIMNAPNDTLTIQSHTDALRIAAFEGCEEIAELLITDKRFNLNEVKDGLTILQIAERNGHKKIADMIKSAQKLGKVPSGLLSKIKAFPLFPSKKEKFHSSPAQSKQNSIQIQNLSEEKNSR